MRWNRRQTTTVLVCYDGGFKECCVALVLVIRYLLRLEIALAFDLASALEDAPHACKERSNRVGSPFGLRSGPGILPIRARNEARRGLSPDFTGGFRLCPCARADARPFSLRPPLGFFPSLRCQAGEVIIRLSFLIHDHRICTNHPIWPLTAHQPSSATASGRARPGTRPR